MNILIVKLSAVGDVVLSLPFLDALRTRFPEARLTWLVEEAAADIVVDHPQLDRVIISRRKSWIKAFQSGKIIEAVRDVRLFLKELRSEPFDLVVDLHGLFKSGILVWLSKGKRRLGHDKTQEFSYLFLNEKLTPYDPDRHALLRYLDIAAYLGADVSEPRYYFPVNEQAVCAAERLLNGLNTPMIAVNPGAKWRSKLWPVRHWQRFCREMGTRNVSLVLTGGPDERETNRYIGQNVQNLLNLTGQTSLKTLAEIFRKATLVVCPDTGPMHLAAAVGTPVVSLFGPTAPWRTGPFGNGHVILRTGTDCSPCFKRDCADPHCMTGQEPDRLLEVVTAELLKRTSSI